MRNFPSDLFSSLQFRLALGFIFALAVALLLIALAGSVVADRQADRFQRDRDSAQVARVRQFVSNYYATEHELNGASPGLQEFLERAGPVSGVRIAVFDRSGALIADSHTGLPPSLIEGDDRKRWKRKDEIQRFPLFRDGNQIGAFTVSDTDVPAPGPGGPVQANPVAGRISDEVKRSLFWAGIGAAALGTVLVWLLSRRTLAPLQNLGAAARRLGGGDLSSRAESGGPSEIRDLAQSFNTMAAQLEEAERHRRNLTADISHELRTPLSNIQGYLEAIKDGVVQPTPETIDTIHAQATHLSRLVEDLRLLAQMEAGALLLELHSTGVPQLLHSCMEAVRPRAEAKGVQLHLDVEQSMPLVDLDPTRISQVLSNLLENAITHTPQDGGIAVSARRTGGVLEVAVADTGAGIAPEDLPRLFERFYRSDPSRDRNTGGAGLGLTIARRLVEAHGGTIHAESVLGEGSTFTLRLPA